MKKLITGLALLMLLSSPLWADKRPSLIGDFVMEDKDSKDTSDPDLSDNKLRGSITIEEVPRKTNPYEVNQALAIEFVKGLNQSLDSLAAGQLKAQNPLTEGITRHLSGAYLYCLLAKGACPALLDTILEVDIINSRLQHKAGCPNMTRFWIFWQKNGLDRKHSFSLPTGFLKKYESFRSNQLPKYIDIKTAKRCTNTVDAEINLSAEASDSAFFKKRYGEASLQRDAVLKTMELLDFIKDKIPNVFEHLRLE